jgi:signal peptidase I
VPVDEPYAATFTDTVGDFPLPSEAYDDVLRWYHDNTYGEQMTTQTVYRVPAGHYFILNDNRKELWDSRLLGPISQDQLIAKLRLVWKPSYMLFALPKFLLLD